MSIHRVRCILDVGRLETASGEQNPELGNWRRFIGHRGALLQPFETECSLHGVWRPW